LIQRRSIASVAVDSNGVIWAGDLNGEVYRYDRTGRSFTIAPIRNNKRVVALHAARNGDVWIGTYVGLNGLRRDDGLFP